MVAWPILAAREAGAGRVAVIVSPDRDISAGLPAGTETVDQPQADGTGGAIRAALDDRRDAETVVVLSGDHPADLRRADRARCSTPTATRRRGDGDDRRARRPRRYGRVVRDADGEFERIVEAKTRGDATPEELAISEVNTGTYVFDAEPLAEALEPALQRQRPGRVLPRRRAAAAPRRGAARRRPHRRRRRRQPRRQQPRRPRPRQRRGPPPDPRAPHARRRHDHRPRRDLDRRRRRIAADATIEPGTTLRGATEIGAGSVVGPHTTLIDTKLGERVAVPHSYLVECEVLDGCSVGPFAYIRPRPCSREGRQGGRFVEIKNSEVGAGPRCPTSPTSATPRSAPDTNLGAGTITANYDGFRKHRTVIGDTAGSALTRCSSPR